MWARFKLEIWVAKGGRGRNPPHSMHSQTCYCDSAALVAQPLPSYIPAGIKSGWALLTSSMQRTSGCCAATRVAPRSRGWRVGRTGRRTRSGGAARLGERGAARRERRRARREAAAGRGRGRGARRRSGSGSGSDARMGLSTINDFAFLTWQGCRHSPLR